MRQRHSTNSIRCGAIVLLLLCAPWSAANDSAMHSSLTALIHAPVEVIGADSEQWLDHLGENAQLHRNEQWATRSDGTSLTIAAVRDELSGVTFIETSSGEQRFFELKTRSLALIRELGAQTFAGSRPEETHWERCGDYGCYLVRVEKLDDRVEYLRILHNLR